MTALETRIALDTYRSLQDVPFNCPVTVTAGAYQDTEGIYLDESVLMFEGGEIEAPSGWELVTGYGSYTGVFEPAQYITGRMSEQIAGDHEGQVLALCEVTWVGEDEDEMGDDMPVGWAILARLS